MKRISLNKVMAKLAEEQTPEQLELAQMDVLKMLNGSLQGPKNFWNNIEAARDILHKQVFAISDNNKVLKQDLKMLDDKLALAKELGVDDVIKEINRVKGMVETRISSWTKTMDDVDSAWSKLKL